MPVTPFDPFAYQKGKRYKLDELALQEATRGEKTRNSLAELELQNAPDKYALAKRIAESNAKIGEHDVSQLPILAERDKIKFDKWVQESDSRIKNLSLEQQLREFDISQLPDREKRQVEKDLSDLSLRRAQTEGVNTGTAIDKQTLAGMPAKQQREQELHDASMKNQEALQSLNEIKKMNDILKLGADSANFAQSPEEAIGLLKQIQDSFGIDISKYFPDPNRPEQFSEWKKNFLKMVDDEKNSTQKTTLEKLFELRETYKGTPEEKTIDDYIKTITTESPGKSLDTLNDEFGREVVTTLMKKEPTPQDYRAGWKETFDEYGEPTISFKDFVATEKQKWEEYKNDIIGQYMPKKKTANSLGNAPATETGTDTPDTPVTDSLPMKNKSSYSGHPLSDYLKLDKRFAKAKYDVKTGFIVKNGVNYTINDEGTGVVPVEE